MKPLLVESFRAKPKRYALSQEVESVDEMFCSVCGKMMLQIPEGNFFRWVCPGPCVPPTPLSK